MSTKRKNDTMVQHDKSQIYVHELESRSEGVSLNHSTKEANNHRALHRGAKKACLICLECVVSRLGQLNVIKGLDKTGRCPWVKVWKWQRVRTLVSTVPSSP